MTEPSAREKSRRHLLSIVGALLGSWLILSAIGLVATGFGWLLAIPIAAVGVFLVAKALPGLRREPPDSTPSDRRLVPEAGRHRLRCPCCGCPSLDPDVPNQSCPACEWSVDGLPGAAAAPPEAIAAARENFRRFLSVYPPDARPGWSPDPPTADELALRRELIELYARALSEPEDSSVWWKIAGQERRVRDLELEYSAEVEARAGDELEAEEERELDAEEKPELAAERVERVRLPEPPGGSGREPV